jgi:hypothetical protein
MGLERVCKSCGEVADSELDVTDAPIDAPIEMDNWLKDTTFGPATDPRIQSFMLPTFAKVRNRDAYFDVHILHKLRVYTDLLGACGQFSIPKRFAAEAMALFLKSVKFKDGQGHGGMYKAARPMESLKATLYAAGWGNRVEAIEAFESELAMGPQTEELTKKEIDNVLDFAKGRVQRPKIIRPAKNPPAPEGFKTCGKCKELRPCSEFYKDKSSKDGLFHWCKPCMKKKRLERKPTTKN